MWQERGNSRRGKNKGEIGERPFHVEKGKLSEVVEGVGLLEAQPCQASDLTPSHVIHMS